MGWHHVDSRASVNDGACEDPTPYRECDPWTLIVFESDCWLSYQAGGFYRVERKGTLDGPQVAGLELLKDLESLLPHGWVDLRNFIEG